MTYKINGVDIATQPERGQWLLPQQLGDDGNNRPVYPAPLGYEMYFGLLPTATLVQLWNAWLSTSTTGTAVVDLPKIDVDPQTFYSFSGVVFERPEVGPYFVDHTQQVKFIVRNVILP